MNFLPANRGHSSFIARRTPGRGSRVALRHGSRVAGFTALAWFGLVPAIGAGLELAAACDLRIASDNAMFSMPEVRLGIPSVVEAALLPRLIGTGRARWLVLTGETIDARQALDWRFVDHRDEFARRRGIELGEFFDPRAADE